MHWPLVGCHLLQCKTPANLVLTLQLVCISASHSSASLPSLDFFLFFPCFYNKFCRPCSYCQWHLSNSTLCNSLPVIQMHAGSKLRPKQQTWDAPTTTGTCIKALWKWNMESWRFRSPFQGCVGALGGISLKTSENVVTKENKPNSQMITFPFTGKPFLTHLLPLMSPVRMSNVYN